MPDSSILSIRSVSKTFPGQRALDDSSITLRAGEVHGLVGQNGSGKSTLIKVLAGYHTPDPGAEGTMDGAPFEFGSPLFAQKAGLRFIHQDLGLVPALNAVDNFALDRGYRSRWWVSLRKEARATREALRRVGAPAEIDIDGPVERLSPLERSLIAIARALRDDREKVRVVVLDEPTEALPRPDVQRLFEAIRAVVAHGAAVLYVSHRLDEVLDISDEVTVLRDGAVVACRSTTGLDHEGLVRLMVGSWLPETLPARAPAGGQEKLRVSGLRGGLVNDVSFEVRAGEILGIAGLAGSGREELAYLLGGARPTAGGSIDVGGVRLLHPSPRSCLGAGLVFVPADRATESAILTMSTRENLTLPRVDVAGPLRWLGNRTERRAAREWLERTGVVPTDPDRLLATLSGGNQQKVVLARALRCEPVVLVLDEPVQGVDVASRHMVFELIANAARGGAAVVVASTEPEDLVTLCDRVLVLHSGRVISELEGSSLTEDRINYDSLSPAAGASS